MKFGYKFSNLCGTVYKCANVLYTPSGSELLSAVGSRVTVFDLSKHTSLTLPFETKNEIHRMAISPDGRLLLVVDVDGNAVCLDFPHRTVLYRFNFKAVPKETNRLVSYCRRYGSVADYPKIVIVSWSFV